MKLSKKAEELEERYLRFGVTNDHLIEFRNLGIITKEEYDYIRSLRIEEN